MPSRLLRGGGSNNIDEVFREGRVLLPKSSEELSIVFDSAFAENCSSVVVSIENTIDDFILGCKISNKTLTGFCVQFSNEISNSGTYLNYLAKGQ